MKQKGAKWNEDFIPLFENFKSEQSKLFGERW